MVGAVGPSGFFETWYHQNGAEEEIIKYLSPAKTKEGRWLHMLTQ